MAEALVSIAVGVVAEQLTEVSRQQLSLFAGATRELEKLSDTFQSITAVLADAESRQVSDESVKLWLSRLRHAAYDVEDLLVDASNHAVSRYNVPLRIKRRYDVAHRIKEIRERLDQINDERNRFSFSSSPQGRDQRELERSQQRLTTSLMDESEMVIGREDDKETLVRRLVSESSTNEDQGQVQVVSIVGIGGLGKTTLARQIYHDAKVRDRFNHHDAEVRDRFNHHDAELRDRFNHHDAEVRDRFNQALYWVCVSDVFDVIRLTKAILGQVKGLNNFPSELDDLQKELLEALRGKRFLLVLDDVWNHDAEKWKLLLLPLTSGANGSRILVTTRSEKVAHTNHIHKLEGLSDEHSWRLFSSKAFAGWRESDCSEFESIGKEIVKKCKGVPLSIKVIGSAMNTKKTVEDWKNVLESKIWTLPQATDNILPALLLTYWHLPPCLKQCFVYCSMFPKDWEFEKDTLIRLWVVQGFIPSQGNREKEDIGEEYFNDLVAWSMFQEIKENYKGKIICKIHDLLHHLAEFIAMYEIYCSEGGKSEESSSSICNVRHAFLSFNGSYDKPSNIPIATGRLKKLRTLWLDGTVGGGITSVIDGLFHEARFLRALCFPSSTALPKSFGKLKHLRYLRLPKIAELSATIGKMKQLRYLDLSDSKIVELPETVSDLCNLHTLNLRNCEKLEKLPRGMGGMVSLKYLDLSQNKNIVELPESVSDLCKLHTLNLSRCKKLEKLPTGFGRMVSLRYLDLSWSAIVELLESVSDLRNLHTLNLSYCLGLKKLPGGICRMVSLRRLKIEGTYELKYLPKGLGRISGLRSLSEFIVGDGDEREGCGIEELQPLNSLQGRLRIQHLQRVSSREEAEKAELWKKKYLCSLELTRIYERRGDADTGKIDSVLEGLRPHENLEELTLSSLNGSKLPSWMDGMRCLLTLRLCSQLILDRVPRLTSLKEFHISGVKNEILPGEGWEQLVALEKLRIAGIKELKCLPAGVTQLPSLENLEVWNCDKLESLPEGLRQLKKLNSLCVTGLRVLRCLPDSVGELESLESLSIRSCQKLESLPVSLGQLKKLKSLCVGGSEVLRCLPDSVGQLESLKRLEINSLKKLESLPDSLGQLEALNELRINYCEALASLPQGMRHLSLLQTLVIGDCPLLTERCKREGGADWPNISHIPRTSIFEGDRSGADSDPYSSYARYRALFRCWSSPLEDDAHECSEEEEALGAAPLDDDDAHEDSEEEAPGSAPLDDDANEGLEEVTPGQENEQFSWEEHQLEQTHSPQIAESEEQQERIRDDDARGAAMDLPLDDDASEDPEEVARAAKMDLSVDNVAQEGHAVSPGSEDDIYCDAEPSLESDDDFQSVGGDFTPSSGSTPEKRRSTTPAETSVGNKKNKIT